MTLLRIRTLPDPVLRQKAAAVAVVDAAIVQLLDDMLETMYPNQGAGLAAPQVGVSKRVVVIDVNDPPDPAHALQMVNPEILSASTELYTHNEGCLSVPDQFAPVSRPKRIRVKYLDRHGKEQILDAEDLLSICIQHEIDHLDGKVFVDHLSPLKRRMLMKRYDKRTHPRDETL
jgi:peptide deformylase